MSPRCVPFLDLKALHAPLLEQFEAAFREQLERGDYIQGGAVRQFEQEFGAFCGSPYCVGAANGTAALHVIIEALGIGRGDEVILPSHTFVATAESIRLAGATPVFAEIRPDTWLLDPEAVRAAKTERTKAIVAVHLYGMPCAMDELNAFACSEGLPVIEDAAQGHGATLGDRRVGNLGLAAAFSFYPGKNLGALGDGGAVTTLDPKLASRMARYVNHGREGKFEHLEMGTNYRLDTLQASLLRIKLPHLEGWNNKRRVLAAHYRARLSDIRFAELGLQFQADTPGANSCWHLFVITTPNRDAIAEALKAKGIQTGMHYPIPTHLQPSMAICSGGQGSLPITECVAASLLSLPMGPTLTTDDVDYVCDCLLVALQSQATTGTHS